LRAILQHGDNQPPGVPIQIVALHRMVVNQKMNERLKLAMVEKRSQ